MKLKRHLPPARNLIIAIPWFWLALFFLLPFLFVLKISLSEPVLAQPPYLDLLREIEDGLVTIMVNFGNYQLLLEDSLYLSALLGSLKVAAISTLCCLFIGYPMAYAIARSPSHWRLPLLMLIILPFWTSFLIRIYAWIGILKGNGLLNNFLLWTGLIVRSLYRRGLQLSAVCGVAALRHPDPTGSDPAGSGRRSGLSPLEAVFADHPAAVAAGRTGRCHAGVHSGDGRIRHSRPAGRA
jgi:putrescine transport system permease protein